MISSREVSFERGERGLPEPLGSSGRLGTPVDDHSGEQNGTWNNASEKNVASLLPEISPSSTKAPTSEPVLDTTC